MTAVPEDQPTRPWNACDNDWCDGIMQQVRVTCGADPGSEDQCSKCGRRVEHGWGGTRVRFAKGDAAMSDIPVSAVPGTTQPADLDAIKFYDGAANGYRLEDDPRCLFGWGPPTCPHSFGHACFRPLGHKGKCWDGGDSPATFPGSESCYQRQRPADWDSKQRAEVNS